MVPSAGWTAVEALYGTADGHYVIAKTNKMLMDNFARKLRNKAASGFKTFPAPWPSAKREVDFNGLILVPSSISTRTCGPFGVLSTMGLS